MTLNLRKPILTALVLIASSGAFARDNGVFAERYPGPVAELSQEERLWLRERWQRLPPDERSSLRKELRERWTDTPPEARQRYREELKERLKDERDHGRRDKRDDDDGYGRGYETRTWERDDSDHRRNRH